VTGYIIYTFQYTDPKSAIIYAYGTFRVGTTQMYIHLNVHLNVQIRNLSLYSYGRFQDVQEPAARHKIFSGQFWKMPNVLPWNLPIQFEKNFGNCHWTYIYIYIYIYIYTYIYIYIYMYIYIYIYIIYTYIYMYIY